MGTLIISFVLTLAFAIFVYSQLSDENINTWRGVCIIASVILLIVIIILARGSTVNLAGCFGLSLLILVVLGIFAEIKCGAKATVCPNCRRKDSVRETVTERMILDRVFSSFDKNGRALYNVTYDETVHVYCKNCGHEYDYVRRGRRNDVYQ